MEARLIALKLFLDELEVPETIATIDDRKRVQKAVYLGQLAGVPLGYRFGWYKKGPYSPDLTKDYYELADAIVMGDQEYQGKRLLEPLRDRLQQIRPLLCVPVDVSLSSEDWLELVASVHYLHKISKLSDTEVMAVLRNEKPQLEAFANHAEKALGEAELLNWG